MSSKIDIQESSSSEFCQVGWTTIGTARSQFVGELGDEFITNQIAIPNLPQPLKILKYQFAKIHIGSELFFQALEFLYWMGNRPMEGRDVFDQRFYVLLSGLLLMRKANILGSICLPRDVLENQIFSILQNSGFSKKSLTPEFWITWMLTSFKNLEISDDIQCNGTIFLEQNSLIYFRKNWYFELQLLSLIKERIKMNLNSPNISIVENVLEEVLETNPIRFDGEALKLSTEQKKAILFAISSPLLIITGGPGTGKTSVVVILLRVLRRLGMAENPALASPTGRATKRMYESIVDSIRSIENLDKLKKDKELLEVATEAKTLHRLLRYDHGTHTFRNNEYEPLENDLLIIDESSMIDQQMMISLLKAANSKLPHQPSVLRMILIGDANQLPSVGVGAILSSLTLDLNENEQKELEKKHIKIVRLFRNYRQDIKDSSGKNILGVAEVVKNMVNNPYPELLFENKFQSPHETIRKVNSLKDVVLEKVSFLDQKNSDNQLRDFSRWWVEHFLMDERFCLETQKEFPFDALESCIPILEYLFNYLDLFRVLTLTQVYRTGSGSINRIIREIWLSENDKKNLFSLHYPGEPVMVTENNYLLQLFNGDIGIFLKFFNPYEGKLELKAVFQVDGVFKTFHERELQNLQTAYAITVHKSQGSEYDNLALILPDITIGNGKFDPGMEGFREIMTREMLYTALTRAKKSVLILGEQNVLEILGLNRVLRYSGLTRNILSNKVY